MYRSALGSDIVDIEFPECDERIGRNVADHCERFPQWLFVSEVDGEIAGFVTFLLKPEKGLGILDDNAVDPKHQGKGIAVEMYKAVLKHMYDQGIEYARVMTGLDEAHAPARRAYEKAGFNVRHEDVTYYFDLRILTETASESQE
jgi:ribosomal protein S18 acetylase RimI-like enzyme